MWYKLRSFPVSFATYPEKIFNGFVKVLFYTIVPVAYIAYLPVRTLLNNSPMLLLLMFGITILFVLFAFLTFNLGLKKYTSTNLMSSRV